MAEDKKQLIYVWCTDFRYIILPPDVLEKDRETSYFTFSLPDNNPDKNLGVCPNLDDLALILSHQYKEHPLRFEVSPELGHFRQTNDYETYRRPLSPEEQTRLLEALRAN